MVEVWDVHRFEQFYTVLIRKDGYERTSAPL